MNAFSSSTTVVLVSLLLLTNPTYGESLVRMSAWGGATLRDGVFGRHLSSYNPRDAFSNDREVFGRFPLRNSYSWSFVEQTPTYERMEWAIECYSTFVPEREVFDRQGNFIELIPARNETTSITVEVPLIFSEPVYVRSYLVADGIRGVKELQIDYLGQSITYETDPFTHSLLPSTTLIPEETTVDPLDVRDFSDWFLVEGEGVIDLSFESAYLQDGTLLDGELRFTIEFAQASSWNGDYDFNNSINALDFLDWQRLDGSESTLSIWEREYTRPSLVEELGIGAKASEDDSSSSQTSMNDTIHRSASSLSIPEPSTMTLLLLTLALSHAGRKLSYGPYHVE